MDCDGRGPAPTAGTDFVVPPVRQSYKQPIDAAGASDDGRPMPGLVAETAKVAQAFMEPSRALASRLPEDCARSVLALLAVKDIPAAAACSRAWGAAARTSELWMALVSTRWPSASSGALRQAVMCRGPREYYRQQTAVLRAHTPRRPPLDLENLLVQIELTQNGRVICSVAREARDVLRWACEDTDGRARDGIEFDNLHARVDTSKCNQFPPEEADPVSISYSVIRKSDGRVAALVPAAELEVGSGTFMGHDPSIPDLGQQPHSFAANPSLYGFYPVQCQQRTLLDVEPHDVSTSWLLQRMGEGHVCKTLADVHIGTSSELREDSEPWVPSADASVAVGEDYVELRRILVTFSLHLKRPLTEDDSDDEEGFVSIKFLNLDEIRRAFDQRLVFR